jgi:hypothetical protein
MSFFFICSFLDENVYLDIFQIGEMEEWIKSILDEEKRKRGIPVEVKNIERGISQEL